jgi:hypothetical protein
MVILAQPPEYVLHYIFGGLGQNSHIATASLSTSGNTIIDGEIIEIVEDVAIVRFPLTLINVAAILGLDNVLKIDVKGAWIGVFTDTSPSKSIDLFEMTVSVRLTNGAVITGKDALQLSME